MAGSTLEYRHVTGAVEGGRVARPVSFRLEAGQRLGLAGPSGSGKTTLLRLAAGLDRPDGAVVLRDGAPARQQPPPGTVGMVFQDFGLWYHLTAAAHLRFVLGPLKLPRLERRARADTMLAAVGLADKARARPARLSGGEQQRLAIARALVTRPRLLLLDEPFAHLDAANLARVRALVHAIQQETGASLLVATHRPDETTGLADACVDLAPEAAG